MVNLMKNLFDFATKELSQDAFICWLISSYDSEIIGKISYDFINHITNWKFEYGSIKAMEIEQQFEKMDILIRVWTSENKDESSKYIIVIEDKADSSAHEKQLLEYGKKIDSWGKCEDRIIKIFYKSNYLSWHDVNELNRYYHYLLYKDTSEFKNQGRIKYKDVWNVGFARTYNKDRYTEKEWRIIDIELINDFFSKYINKNTDSEIFDSYVKYICAKYKSLQNIDIPENNDILEWVSFFKRTVSKEISEDYAFSVDMTPYGYAYLIVRVHPYFNYGPYLEVRSRDFISNKLQSRILTYGMDDENKETETIKNKIVTYLKDNTTIFKPNNSLKKQLGVSYFKCDTINKEAFIDELKQHILEFEKIIKSISK